MVALESELACPAAPWRVRGPAEPRLQLQTSRPAAAALRPAPTAAAQPSLNRPSRLQRLPLAARPSPIPDLSTATLIEWARATAAHSAGALAALALAALLLLAFGLWRTLRCGLACVVPPRPPPRSAAARSILRGPGARSIKCLLGLCAAATLGGSIYGLVQVRTALVPEAQTVVNTAEATLRGALDAGHGLHEALAGLANATLALGTALQAGAPPGVPALEAAGQQLGLTSSRLSTGAATVDAVLEGLGSAVLGDAGVLHTARTQYLPLAQTGESL